MPEISVILPTHNGEKYIQSSVESVLTQDADFELIIVDDASTDNTPQIIAGFKKLDKRVKIITNAKNKQLPESLNIGFREASGKYFTWTSDDNLLKPHALSVMAKHLNKNPHTDLVCADMDIVAEDLTVIKPSIGKKRKQYQLFFGDNIGACFMYRKNVVEKFGEYDKNWFCVEDYEYWCRISRGGKIDYLNDNLYTYRTHPKSLTNTRSDLITQRTRLVQAAYFDFDETIKKNSSADFFSYIVYQTLLYKRYPLSYLTKLAKRNLLTATAGLCLGLLKILRKNSTEFFGQTTEVSQISAENWSEIYNQAAQNICKDILDGNITPWTAEIEKLTTAGDSVIEIGSAIGTSSLYLATKGRRVTLLDYCNKSLETASLTAKSLNVHAETVCADINYPLPIKDNNYDVVWSAGLLEHFSEKDLPKFVGEFARISKNKVVVMVPNALSVAYRLGKAHLIKNKLWTYGTENPQISLKKMFLQLGLKNVREYSIDLNSALHFLPKSLTKSALKRLYKILEKTNSCRQGYLLVTVGEKI